MNEKISVILEQIRTTNPKSIKIKPLVKELIKELNNLKQQNNE